MCGKIPKMNKSIIKSKVIKETEIKKVDPGITSGGEYRTQGGFFSANFPGSGQGQYTFGN